MTAILGISAFYHDSAAALLVDGEIVAAAQEERFSRIKHDPSFPNRSIEYCLQHAKLSTKDLDFVCFSEKPLRKFERLLETYLAFAPSGYRSFRLAIPTWLKQKLHVPKVIRQALPGCHHRPVFIDHHQSHAASAFFPSPFEEAAILTIDGVGEWSTTCMGIGKGNTIHLFKELRFPHSLGLLYSAFTYYAGFRVNSGEYKLMGLAPYGEPRFCDLILKHLVEVKSDGSIRLDMSYFNYCQGLTMTSEKFHKLFGGKPRTPDSPISQRDMDLAASIQKVTEEICLQMARTAHKLYPSKNLVMAGGVALNCVSNGRILREGPFDQIWIQPAAGDAGGALGAASFVWHQLLERPRVLQSPDGQAGSLLGPAFDDSQIAETLKSQSAEFIKCDSDEELCERIAKLLSEQMVVGWFQGRMEFGPRALGARSILGDARNPKMQSVMNLKIKFRESFRPFAPIVLKEKASRYFQWNDKHESPYMLMVAPVRNELRHEPDREQPLRGLDKLNQNRSTLPAVTHVDFSSRLQTVDQFRNPLLHQLLVSFDKLTECPVLINTSFNVRGEPIVCTPEQAYQCFMATDIDVLAIGRFILLKSEQSSSSSSQLREQYLGRFQLD